MKLPQPDGTVQYDVKASDTLASIALRFNTTPTEVSRLNRLASSLLYPGQTLFVPDKTASQKESSRHNDVISSEPRQDRPTELFDLSKKQEQYLSQRSFSPDSSLEKLLDSDDLHVRPDEVSRRYLKIKAKYITDGQGVVSGILLVTPQTLMFNPDVSDHLVMDRGHETYIVRAPLKSISSVVFYDDIAAMVTGDEERIYNPSISFIDYDRSLSPKPGIVCQGTGEKFDLCSSEHSDKSSPQTPPCDNVSECRTIDECSEGVKSISTDHGIGSMSETQSSETTLRDENVISDDEQQKDTTNREKEREKVSLFMQETKLSSTPKHTHNKDAYLVSSSMPQTSSSPTQPTTHSCLPPNTSSDSYNENTTGGIETLNISSPEPLQESSLDSTRVKNDIDKNKTLENVDESSQRSTSRCHDGNKNNENISEKENSKGDCVTGNSVAASKDAGGNTSVISPAGDAGGNTSVISPAGDAGGNTSVISPAGDAGGNTSVISPTGDLSKDSGISEYTPSLLHHDSHENVPHEHANQKSSLSSEARQWLGKRGIRLTSMEEEENEVSSVNSNSTDDISVDVAPRPARRMDDLLMYAAIKIHRSYWYPSRTKQNSIMGIPPNRDQKRRQHWFAIPKHRVDQMNGFLMQWAPDANAMNSGLSTPASEEILEKSDDEGIEFVDDTFNTSPATSFGFQKIMYDDVPTSKLVESIHSVSSRSSLRSLYDDEPELLAESSLLTRKQLGQLSRKLPSRTVGHSLELVYSTTLHGFSLTTLYRNFSEYDASALILCKDEHERVFGAFISESPKVSEGFYGTGESLLFSFSKENKVKMSMITVGGRNFQRYFWRDSDMHGDLQIYRWSGENNFFIKGSKSSFCIGGGEGVFGLWLDGDLYRGRSHSCKTFDNDTLSEKEDFICTGLEAWAFV